MGEWMISTGKAPDTVSDQRGETRPQKSRSGTVGEGSTNAVDDSGAALGYPPEEGAERGEGLRPSERQQQILAEVIKQGSVRNEDLAERFGVSVMTVNRDLNALDSQGLLRRTRGGATVQPSALYESSTVVRMATNTREKQALAQAAIKHVEAGQAIVMDDSTTGIYFARLIPAAGPATVITNFMGVFRELTGRPEIRLIVAGGTYYDWADAFMGTVTADTVRNFSADLAILSTSAVTNGVCYHQSEETVQFKRAMMDIAARRILYADHTKFERRALHTLAPLSAFDLVIVDDHTPQHVLDELAERAIPVEIATTRS